MDHRNQHILIAGDSRIRGLENYLRTALDDIGAYTLILESVVVPGAGVTRVVEATRARCQREEYEQIYLLAGVCDLMQRRAPRNLVPSFQTAAALNLYMEESYLHAQQELLQLTTRPVICEVIGMDVKTYNVNGQHYPNYQVVIDTSIPIINRRINIINAGLATAPRAPFTAGYVHKTRRGKLTHRYDLALRDGLHYTDYYKIRLARALARSIMRNR